MTNAIELNHISKSFGEFSLKNVTLAIPAGTICGLVGENGAGKSTLIRILMGRAAAGQRYRRRAGAWTSPPRIFWTPRRTSAWCWTRGAFLRPSPPRRWAA